MIYTDIIGTEKSYLIQSAGHSLATRWMIYSYQYDVVIRIPKMNKRKMIPFGVKRGDFGCCPGHDKFPWDTYKNKRSKKAQAIYNSIVNYQEDFFFDGQ
jgi:hypothetical protein